jgi:Ca-activated chloride channel family protein
MLELATPWALACLPLPLLIWRLWPRASIKNRQALIIPFFNALAQLHHESPKQQTRPPLWLILTWLFIVIAASGPRWVGLPAPLEREGHNIMLALDVSGSMAMDDMIWHGQANTRLDVVKRAAEAFVQARTDDRIGLILFGTRAYLQTPLTYDKHSVLLRIDDASVGLAGKSTALGDPIGLAVKHLKHAPRKGRLMILLTDGANNSGMVSPLKAAELARAEGIKIHTIGLGSNAAMLNMVGFSPAVNGNTDLDEKTLETIASTTGGQYFRATDPGSLQRIYQLINQMETVPQAQATIRPQHDYYPWPLLLALCAFMGGLLEETGLLIRLQQRIRRRLAR